MPHFLETIHGLYLNVDHIRSLFPKTTGRGSVIIATDERGHDHECYATLKDFYPTIPAQPGFVLLSMHFDYDNPPLDLVNELAHNPIIAWRMMPYVAPEPIIPDDPSFAAGELQAIQCPDGKIIVQGETSFDTIDDLLKYARKQWENHIATHRKTTAA
jgi:hypothetical protein